MSGEVFRKPYLPIVFSTLVGSGFQMTATFSTVIVLSITSLYTPLNTLYWTSLMMGMFPVLGIVNGYISARMYKFFNGTNWMTLSTISMLFVSGFFSACLALIYLLEAFET